MQSRTPFARANMLRAMIEAMTQQAFSFGGGGMVALQEALAGFSPYRSHGKGRAGHQASSRSVVTDKRDARKARNQARHKRAVRGKR